MDHRNQNLIFLDHEISKKGPQKGSLFNNPALTLERVIEESKIMKG